MSKHLIKPYAHFELRHIIVDKEFLLFAGYPVRDLNDICHQLFFKMVANDFWVSSITSDGLRHYSDFMFDGISRRQGRCVIEVELEDMAQDLSELLTYVDEITNKCNDKYTISLTSALYEQNFHNDLNVDLPLMDKFITYPGGA